MIYLPWLADAILAVLLLGTLIMSIRLDRALRVVRRDRSAFETLITNLSAATVSVKTGIQALRSEAERAAEQIERRTVDADKMATDLSFLIEAAERAAALLDGRVQPSQAEAASSGTVADVEAEMADALQTGNAAETRPEPRKRPVAVEAAADNEPAKQDGSTGTVSDLYKLAGMTTRRRPAAERWEADEAVSPAKRVAR